MPSLTMTGALTTWRFAPLVSTALAEEEERDERRVGPDDQQHEVQLAQPLPQHDPGGLGEPQVEAGEEPEHAAREQRLVEVPEDEVAVVDLVVDRRVATRMPVRPPTRNWG